MKVTFSLQYVVMVNYGLEGWKPWGETNDFGEAVSLREEAMGSGSHEVIIMRPVRIIYKEGM
jgi:hypothetical protein